ncbi:hypothetical protein [Roseovarius pelagicus]|uniref:Uncharacterized protein n=1 Tax=Roseovarius pelagicus TaxID=2980108 RepID=A0ABY6D654_9RHOB|nr:hypothetical protein [Roseovarius pelagicus]UXX81622.1 hypothetical protein N7U68_10765 [Roseovarius pelagicus]
MSNGYRNGAFALGLVVGIGIALNLFLWLDYGARHEVEAQSGAGQNTQYSEVGRYWDGFIGVYVSPSDTLAQWVMAFFAIAATGVLILTLWSANKTNIAAVKASKAALEANQIMREGQRPWATVTVNGIKTNLLDPEVIVFDVATTIANEGKNPMFLLFDEAFAWNPTSSKDSAASTEFEKRMRECERIRDPGGIFTVGGIDVLPPGASLTRNYMVSVNPSDETPDDFGAIIDIFVPYTDNRTPGVFVTKLVGIICKESNHSAGGNGGILRLSELRSGNGKVIITNVKTSRMD